MYLICIQSATAAAAAAAVAAALCVSLLLLLLQQQCCWFLLLFVIVCRMTKYDVGLMNLIPFFLFIQARFTFDVPLGSTVSHLRLGSPASSVIAGMRGDKAGVSPPRRSPLCILLSECINVFFAHIGIFYFPAAGRFSCSRLRGTQGARPNTTALVRALVEVRGTCSGGSKSQVTTGRHSEHVEASGPMKIHVKVKKCPTAHMWYLGS